MFYVKVLVFYNPRLLFLLELSVFKIIYLFILLFILAMLDLSCGTQDLRCGMWAL